MRTTIGVLLFAAALAAGCVGCWQPPDDQAGTVETDLVADLRAVAVPATSDTLRPLTAVLHELAVVWYSLTDAELRFGCRDRGLARLDWSPPTEGSPVQRYVVDLWIRGTVWGDTTCVVPIPVWADSGRARAAGVDSLGGQGEWSDLLDWHVITED